LPVPDELVPIAVVTRPHGLRGEVRARLHNPGSVALSDVERVVLRTATDEREVRLVRAGPAPGGGLLLVLEGVATREGAEALRGAELCVPRAALPHPGAGEWYHLDLVGLEVRSEDGARVGTVDAVQPYPSVDCLVVRGDDGVREVPMLDRWVLAVDAAGGHVTVGDLSDLPVQGREPEP